MSEPISDELSAAIIAGGKSRRFGAPKALARLGGQSLLDHALRLAGQISSRVLLNYGETDLYAGMNVPLVADVFPGCGPLGGIYSVLQAAQTPLVAVLPCDLPLLPAQVYRLLFVRRQENRPAIARSQRGLEPLVSIWPTTLARELEARLRKGDFALQKAIRELQGVEIPMPEELPGYRGEFFLNVNRKEDLEQIELHLQRGLWPLDC